MIALDTNILVYARREEAPFHREARRLVTKLAEGEAPWALPWPCVYEFLRVVTHHRVFQPPTPLAVALEDLGSLFDSPSLSLLGEGPSHVGHFRDTVLAGEATGNLVGLFVEGASQSPKVGGRVRLAQHQCCGLV